MRRLDGNQPAMLERLGDGAWYAPADRSERSTLANLRKRGHVESRRGEGGHIEYRVKQPAISDQLELA